MTRPLAGFPTSWGNSRVSIMPITGPSSYTQYTAPTTGGQDVDVMPAAGVKAVLFAIGGVSRNGTHRVEVVQIEAANYGGVTIPGMRLILKWYVVATGAQAASLADLDGEIVDVLVIGTS